MAGIKPTVLVIFGITGDLARRKLLPALAAIEAAGQLPGDFTLLGTSRRDTSPNEILSEECASLKKYLKVLKADPENPDDYKVLKQEIEELAASQVIFYFAVPPMAAQKIIESLATAKLNGKKTKLLLEKPFGFDLQSAKDLIVHTLKYFKEEQLYRIDHYLAKEGAQNIAVFLGSNAIFRDIWSYQYIEKIDITAAEKIGIEGRVDFYESTGALKDIVQSHLLHLTALVLMEPCPHDFDFEELPERRLRALKAIEPADPKVAAQGQYEGYKQEVDNPGSRTETFVSVQLQTKDPRWRGVPIFLTTGKKLDEKLTEIRIHFRKAHQAEANQLILRLQPREGIELDLWVKVPGYEHKLQKQPLRFLYSQRFQNLPEAYEQVLIDAMRGSRILFAGSEEVLATWKILQPLIDFWLKGPGPFIYPAGSTMADLQESLKAA